MKNVKILKKKMKKEIDIS